jgi:hypothetical protein
MTASRSFFKSSLQLSNTTTGGSFDLLFQNYPVKPVLNACKTNSLSPTVGILDQAGWVGAWNFYHLTTKEGHLCFTIDPTHRLWDIIDYSNEFKLYSLDGLDRVWRIDNLTMDNTTNVKAICNFTMAISAELRTPAWA